jgi:hypothetical protein
MIGLFAGLRGMGEAAMARARWSLAGAGLGVLALGFAAGAVVALLDLVAPTFVAFGAAALGLMAAAAICLARARAPDAISQPCARGSLDADAGGAAPADGDWRTLLNAALEREAREKPARAAAIAAIAGLILGAVEGLDGKRPDA